jgi:hypothetical protein
MLKSHKFASPLEMAGVRLKGSVWFAGSTFGIPVLRVSMENLDNLGYSISRRWNARD